MKVLIVDDEIKVCYLVRKLIDWDGLNLELAGIIHDGKEALRFIQEEKPEIVITDIRMPGCDGIDMIGQIRQMKLDTRFIIISGYRQFEYASNAIKYDVDDYLLKPLKEKDINRVLLKIIRENDERRAALAEKESLVERVSMDSGRLKERFLNDVLVGKPISEETLSACYGCSFDNGPFLLIVVQNYTLSRTDKQASRILINSKIKAILDGEPASFCREKVSTLYGDQVACLVYGNGEPFGKLSKELRRIGGVINGLSDIFSDIRFFVAASLPVDDIRALPYCVDQAKKTIAQRLLLPANSIVQYKPEYEPDLDPDALITQKVRGDLRYAVSALDDERLALVIDGVKNALQNAPRFTGWDVRTVYFKLIQLFLDATRDAGVKVAEDFEKELAQAYHDAQTVSGLFRTFTDHLVNVIMDWQIGKSAEESRPIRIARKYIHQHYAEPLTLQILSDEVNLNATYFSSAFRRQTNQTFLDYVTQVRINAAKELLADTEIAIGDIAQRVGYQDMKYFYKRFKKFAGLSPKEYRKLYG